MILCSLQFGKGVLNGSLETWLIPQVLTVNAWGTKREPEQSRVTQLGGKTCGGIEARTLMDVESERGVRFPELLKCPKAFLKITIFRVQVKF